MVRKTAKNTPARKRGSGNISLSNVARRPSACRRKRLVAELLLGSQSPCMRPRSIPGALFHSDRLDGPPWVPKGVHWGVWVIGPHTHRG